MGRIVIVGYKPKSGKSEALENLMSKHYALLRDEGLVTDRTPIIMKAEDGTVIEVFEWKSSSAIESAHKNPSVLAMWQEYSGVCDYVPVGKLKESQELFSEFSALTL